MDADGRGELPKALSAALREIFAALAQVCLRHGVSYPEVAELAKRAMIDVAQAEFTIPGRKQSASRMAVLTGMHRKEIARTLSVEPPKDAASRRRVAYAARIIAGWRRDPRFLDSRGRPRPLAVDGSPPNFTGLVKRFGGGDVPVRAVLDELDRVGAVARQKDGRIRLVASAYVPARASAEGVSILGSDVADLIRTIGHNLESDPRGGYFQRKVAYDNLPAEAIDEIHEKVRKDGQALLEALDRVMAQRDRDSNPQSKGTGRKRAMIGIYFRAADVDAEEDPEG